VTVLNHPPYSPDLAPADYLLFPKVKSHLKGRLFDLISDIQKDVTSTLNTIAKDDFYKGIQNLHECHFFHANTFYNASPRRTVYKNAVGFNMLF
jgi:hypothetical protein